MREVYKEMEKNQIESMKDGKDDSNSWRLPTKTT
jgi:hypothetical protein